MPKKPNRKQSYEEIGRMFESIYESGYIDRNKTYKMSFLKGVAAGVGSVIGATVIVALLIWVLNLFDSVPLVGPFTHKIQNTVQTKSN